MKKIAFFVQHLGSGGVENTLLTLTKRLSDEGNEIYIYVIKRKGAFIDKVSKNVTLNAIPMDEKLRQNIPVGGSKVSIREACEQKKYVKATKFFVQHFFDKDGFAELHTDFNKIPRLNEQFDIVVNYHLHSPFLVRYVSEKVEAKKKYAWMHNDFSTTKYDIKKLNMYLGCYDKFFGVSNRIVEEFETIFPEYKSITSTALNIVPRKRIIEKADNDMPAEYNILPNELIILTVGRLEEQKGYDIALSVCEKLVSEKMKFRWYVIGEGTEKNKLLNEIKKRQLENNMYLIGMKKNPYPYFKNCDIYVQTSKHEGYVTTVTEAKIFNKPVVCTDVSGAREQLIDGINGEIASINVNNVFEKLKKLMLNFTLRNEYSRELSKEKLDENPHWLCFFE